MWTPDLVFYNSVSRETDALSTGAAWVNRDGSVWQTVAGTIQVTCQFADLVNFPYDKLGCRVEVASWSLSDLVTNLTFYDDPSSNTASGADYAKGDRGCAEISVQSATTSSAYQEYSISSVECESYTRVYPCCADEPWTQLWINVRLSRHSFYYVMLLQVPGAMITLLSFTVFFLDVKASGERLGLGSTLMLTMLVLSLIASDKLPACGELLWIQILNALNTFFALLAVVQSCFVIHIFGQGIGAGAHEEEAAYKRAEKCDYWAIRTVPPLYLSMLCLVYALRFDDGYALGPDSVDFQIKSFQGMAPKWIISGVGALQVLLVVFALAVARWVACKAKCLPARKRETPVRAGDTAVV